MFFFLKLLTEFIYTCLSFVEEFDLTCLLCTSQFYDNLKKKKIPMNLMDKCRESV